MDSPESSPNIDTLDRYPNAKAGFDGYAELFPTQSDWADLMKIIREYTLKEIAEGASKSTANPLTPDNTAFERRSSLDKTAFLKERLKGRVIDIGSNGIDELSGIIPDEEVVYVDSEPTNQRNFYQVNVGEERLPFAEGSFNGVFSRNAITTEESAAKMLPEMLRVLSPDGKMVLEYCYTDLSAVRKVMSGTFVELEKLGIQTDQQCEVVVNDESVHHHTYPIKLNMPSLLITVSRGNASPAT